MIEILVRNRFVELPGAAAERTRANAWEVRVPTTPEIARAMRRKQVDLEAFDGATFAIDGQESIQAVGTSERGGEVIVSVLLP